MAAPPQTWFWSRFLPVKNEFLFSTLVKCLSDFWDFLSIILRSLQHKALWGDCISKYNFLKIEKDPKWFLEGYHG